MTRQGVRDLSSVKPRHVPPEVQPVNRAHFEIARVALGEHREMLGNLLDTGWNELEPKEKSRKERDPAAARLCRSRSRRGSRTCLAPARSRAGARTTAAWTAPTTAR